MRHSDNHHRTTRHELHLLPGIMDIGSASENHIQLDDPDISPYHAKLVTYFHESFIVDINSQSGIYLNGQRVYKHSVKPGDELQIGQHRFTIKPAREWFMGDQAVVDIPSVPVRLKTGQASR